MRIHEIASNERLVEIESDILSAKSLLKLQGIPRDYYKRRKSLELIIDDILWKNKMFKTLYVANSAEQCDCGKRRSQGDLFKILKYYKPEVTFKEFRGALFNLLNEKKIVTLFCGDIHKRVFVKYQKDKHRDCVIYSQNVEDEFGLTLIPVLPDTPTCTDWYGRTVYLITG